MIKHSSVSEEGGKKIGTSSTIDSIEKKQKRRVRDALRLNAIFQQRMTERKGTIDEIG
jgi:hypothetical protein